MSTMAIEAVFHPSDFSPGDEAAFAHALRVAIAARAELALMHVDEPEAHEHWSSFPGVRDTLRRWGIHPGEANEAGACAGNHF
ncbi:MAG TPA: universal stress protein, partial [Verrucomicrobiae bacterium]|nr:universal stress protein [Verrucomicrobiae bacterium]